MLVSAVVCAWGAPDSSAALTPARRATLLSRIDSALVTVELWLRYDNGQPPRTYRTPQADGEDLIERRCPLELPGFLIGQAEVLSPDLPVDPRFVDSIRVRLNGDTVAARPSAYGVREQALFLDLVRRPRGARPLRFMAASPPYLLLDRTMSRGIFLEKLSAFGAEVCQDNRRVKMRCVPEGCLIIDTAGNAAGISMNGELPLDSSWRCSPSAWPRVTVAEREKTLSSLREAAGNCLVIVELRFRSPRVSPDARGYGRYEDEGLSTEMRALGVRIGSRRLLVLLDIKPPLTARLEQIRVDDGNGKRTAGKFAGSLRDYGAMLVTTDKASSDTLSLSGSGVLERAYALTYRAQVHLSGDERVARTGTVRCIEYGHGYRGVLGPAFGDDRSDSFLFDENGQLVALPLPARSRGESYEFSMRTIETGGGSVALTPASELRRMLSNLPACLDTVNIPLSENEEGRLCWLGVMLQPLDKELARVNGVSEQTNGGETGALVSYVFPHSPADTAGIAPGMLLLRIRPRDGGKPIPIEAEPSYGDRSAEYHLTEERMPDGYLEYLPAPWPRLDDALVKVLSDLGPGKVYDADFVSGGKPFTKAFTTVHSPTHFAIAPRLKSEALGLTVRDLTFEVRRFYQKGPRDPGVVISKVEPGSQASVAGLMPFEVVTHVNGTAVFSVKDFEKLLTKSPEARLSLTFMYRTRQVNIRLRAKTR